MPCTGASRRTMAAIQLVPTESGERSMGVFTQLPADAELTVCEDRSGEKTVKVNFNGTFYLIFREDLNSWSRAVVSDGGSQPPPPALANRLRPLPVISR